ncbi:hypothetical protein ZIOFF_005736 [Zingiber officinale]|uniref:Uncharacterized protein n=1 Tax=Zingiber officinale TaxID=94328 RepID=A0A8J5IB90_ZINOF|nr:hypothetical protein ZIOFF_005736 [Zingiber officinale]
MLGHNTVWWSASGCDGGELSHNTEAADAWHRGGERKARTQIGEVILPLPPISAFDPRDERLFHPGDGDGGSKMYNGLDGFFMNVKEGVDEMIKFLANEPSMGFFFVQKHAHASMPYLLDVKVAIAFLIRKTNEQDAFAPGGDQHGGSSRSYFSSFFSSTRQKAAALGQPQPYTMSKDDRKKHQSLAITSPEGDLLQETVPLFEDLSVQSFELRDYDRFKNDQQVKYEEWLDVPKE